MSHDQAAAADPAIEPGDFAEAAEPFALFETWLADAARHEPNDPNAMALATVDADRASQRAHGAAEGRRPCRRMPRAASCSSPTTRAPRARELIANPHAALDFHWKSLHRQVRVRGPVTQTTPAEADAYFATRPRSAQIGAWASQQSRPLESRLRWKKPSRSRRRNTWSARCRVRPTGRASASRRWRSSSGTAGLSRLHERIVFKRQGRRRRLAQNAPLSLRTGYRCAAALTRSRHRGKREQGAGTIDACQRAATEAQDPGADRRLARHRPRDGDALCRLGLARHQLLAASVPREVSLGDGTRRSHAGRSRRRRPTRRAPSSI